MTTCRCCGQEKARDDEAALSVDQDVHDALNEAYALAEQSGAREVGLCHVLLAFAQARQLAGVLGAFGLDVERLGSNARQASEAASRAVRDGRPATGGDVKAVLAECRTRVDRRKGDRISLADVLVVLTTGEGRALAGALLEGASRSRGLGVATTVGDERSDTAPAPQPMRAAWRPVVVANDPAAHESDVRAARVVVRQKGSVARSVAAGFEPEHATGAMDARQAAATAIPSAQHVPAPTVDAEARRLLADMMAHVDRMVSEVARLRALNDTLARRLATLEAGMEEDRGIAASDGDRLADLELQFAALGRSPPRAAARKGTRRRLRRYRSQRARRLTSWAAAWRDAARAAYRAVARGAPVAGMPTALRPERQEEAAADRLRGEGDRTGRVARVQAPTPTAGQRAPAVVPSDDDDDVPPAGDRPPRFYLALGDDIVDAPSIGPRTAERLRPLGLKTVRDLLQARPARVADSAGARHITAERVASWQHQTRLVCTVPWLRGTHAQLLVGAGFVTPAAIAQADPGALLAAILRFVQTREGQSVLRSGPPPNLEKVVAWCRYAGMAELDRAA